MQVEKTALIIINVQRAFLQWEETGRRRNNSDALSKMQALLAGFRSAGVAIYHIRHASLEHGSALAANASGYTSIAGMEEQNGEPVIIKHVNSSFIGTNLEERLRSDGKTTIVICGITTNHCVETTTRMAGNLGFDARLVEDACYTFDRVGFDGTTEKAEDIHAMTLSNLNVEFAKIETTKSVLSALQNAAAIKGE